MKTRIWYGLTVWLVYVEQLVYGAYTSEEAAKEVAAELKNKDGVRISVEIRRVYS